MIIGEIHGDWATLAQLNFQQFARDGYHTLFIEMFPRFLQRELDLFDVKSKKTLLRYLKTYWNYGHGSDESHPYLDLVVQAKQAGFHVIALDTFRTHVSWKYVFERLFIVHHQWIKLIQETQIPPSHFILFCGKSHVPQFPKLYK